MPFLRLLVLGAAVHASAAESACDPADHADDCLALCDFFNATGKALDGWCNGQSVCSWKGVTCESNTTGRVTKLELNHMVTSGTIPESIGRLSKLTKLDLTNCKLTGKFPESLGDLSEAETIWMGENELTGGIPASVGKLQKVKQFVLHYNRHLGGVIPESVGNMTSLQLLLLNNNSLTGSVPQSLGQLKSLSVGLGLWSNKLTEWKSDSICDLIKAGTLGQCLMNDNEFVCPLPACAANCSATCTGPMVV